MAISLQILYSVYIGQSLRGEVMLKNYMEAIVDDIIGDILEKEELDCKCEHCIEDIKAIALNNLKPMYVATEKGILYSKLREMNYQFKADVVKEIMNGIEKIRQNPRH